MKTIKVKHDKKTDQHYLDLKDFKSIINTKKVKYYSLEPVLDCGDDGGTENKALVLKFYDKDRNLIEAKK